MCCSPQLVNDWTLEKNIASSLKYGHYWELPYLVPLGGRYVLMVGAGNPYWVGSYDPKTMTFEVETPVRQVDTGHYYSFNPHMVDDKGLNNTRRRIMHGYAPIGRPPVIEGGSWGEGAHSIPRIITLKDERLWQEPIPELQKLRYGKQTLEKQAVTGDKPVHLKSIRGDSLEIIASLHRGTAKRCGFIVRADKGGNGISVWADEGDRFGIGERGNVLYGKPGEAVTLRIFVDRGVMEVYCNGGAVTHKCFAKADCVEVFAFSEGGNCTVESLEGWKMKSMWE